MGAKSSKRRWYFYLNFWFQPHRTKNKEMRAKKSKIVSFVTTISTKVS
jgi:hypothetical protein